MLKYSSADGFYLDIPHGGFNDLSQFIDKINNPNGVSNIYGQLRDNRIVSLSNCRFVDGSYNLPGSHRESYMSSLGFVGDIETTSNPSVSCIRVSYYYLRDWVAEHPFSMIFRGELNEVIENVVCEYQALADTELAKGDSWRILLTHKASFTPASVRGFQFSHDCQLQIELQEALSFEEVWKKFIGPLKSFFSFCLDRSTSLKSLEILTSDTNKWLNVGIAQGRAVRLDEKEPSSKRDLSESRLLLSRNSIKDVTSKIITSWLEFEGDERRAVLLLVGINSSYEIPEDLKFLAAAQALEAMSRVFAREEELSQEEFVRRLEVIKASIENKRIRNWAERKLMYSNRRSVLGCIKI